MIVILAAKLLKKRNINRSIFSKNSDKPIVLDSGALVGYLIGNIDNELGGITQMKLRGIK